MSIQTQSISPDQRFAIRPDLLSEAVQGEVVVLDLKAQAYYGLNAVGARVWELLGAQHSLAEVVQQLGVEYDATEAQLLADVEGLLAGLLERGFIEPVA